MTSEQEQISQFVQALGADAIPLMSRMLLVERSSVTDVNTRDSAFYDFTALQFQAKYGTSLAMEWLLRQRCPGCPPPDVEGRDVFYGNTALIWAVCSSEDPEGKVRLLLDHGADRNVKDNNHFSVLSWAAGKPVLIDILENYQPDRSAASATLELMNGKEKISELVQVSGADAIPRISRMLFIDRTTIHINSADRSYSNFTSLHYQTAVGDTETVAWLLRLQPAPDLEARDIGGNTPLILAAFRGNDPIGKVRLLLDYGADRDAMSKSGKTALDYARRFDKHVAADILQHYFPDVSR